MNEQPPSAIFGLNFLQDMKGASDAITGAYDPEQELWTTQGQTLLDEEALANVTGGNAISDVIRGLEGTSVNSIDRVPRTEFPSPRPATSRETRSRRSTTTSQGNADAHNDIDSSRD
jgi:hypothetical protein